MATFALIHGGGGTAWDRHLVAPELRERGHDPVAVDLPCEEESADWWAYAGTVVDAVAERRDVIVVGHLLGGFTAPLVCARMPAKPPILLCGMIPSSGELFNDWWKNAGYEPSEFDDVFYHDVPPQLAAEAQRRERNENSKALRSVASTHGRRLRRHTYVLRRPHVHGRMGAEARSCTPWHRG